MLGTFCVYWDGKPIIGLFRSGMTQPAAALQMILHYRQSGVSKSQLIDYLFEDRDVQNATHSLHVQLHNLRRMLRQAGLPDTNYFRRENDTYFWTPEIPVREDAEEFERICDDVRKAGSGQEELRLCLRACQAYGGDFFGVRTNNGWAAQEARRYEQLFIDCTERAAGRLRENRNYTELERLGQHASRVQPFFDWERLTMEALIEQGRYAEAKKLYMITEQNYRTDMDLPVGRQMTELYQKLPITDAAAASDPGRLWKQMTEEEKEGGAYLCSTPVFEGICRMEKRHINRPPHKPPGASVLPALCSAESFARPTPGDGKRSAGFKASAGCPGAGRPPGRCPDGNQQGPVSGPSGGCRRGRVCVGFPASLLSVQRKRRTGGAYTKNICPESGMKENPRRTVREASGAFCCAVMPDHRLTAGNIKHIINRFFYQPRVTAGKNEHGETVKHEQRIRIYHESHSRQHPEGRKRRADHADL